MPHPSPAEQRSFASRYTIERELGRGASATVFLARDARSDRPVALKVIHRELAESLAAERFLREVRLTATLHHPNLLPLFDAGEEDGRLFFVMPYVGGSLRDRLTGEPQLPVEEAVAIGREVADALAHAHDDDRDAFELPDDRRVSFRRCHSGGPKDQAWALWHRQADCDTPYPGPGRLVDTGDRDDLRLGSHNAPWVSCSNGCCTMEMFQ